MLLKTYSFIEIINLFKIALTECDYELFDVCTYLYYDIFIIAKEFRKNLK